MPDTEDMLDTAKGDAAFLSQLDKYGRLVFSPVGYSMYPMLRYSRDVVVLTRPQGEVKPLDVALYRDDAGRYVLHRVVSVSGDQITLFGDGRLTPDAPVSRDRILAVMTGFYKGDRLIDVRNRAYRLYVRVWHALRRWRRPLLRAVYAAQKLKAFIRKEMHRA